MQSNTVQIRNLVLGDGTPKICIPVTAATFEELEKQLQRIAAAPCDMVEWRADFFQETGDVRWMEKAVKILRAQLQEKPLLFTYRTRPEGGEGGASLEEYEALCMQAGQAGMADLVDVELNRGEELLKRTASGLQKQGCVVIGSYHNFQNTPSREEIIHILVKIQELGADITKAAVMPRSEQDVLTLLSAALAMKEQYGDRPCITMSMGRLGAVSRICGSLTGSALTFATAGRASAPGQMDAGMLAKLLSEL